MCAFSKRLLLVMLFIAWVSTPVAAAEECQTYVQQTAKYLAVFTGKHLTPSLAFVDSSMAEETLKYFAELPWVRFVYVFDAQQALFAHYLAEGEVREATEQTAITALQSETVALPLVKETITIPHEDGKVGTVGYIVLGIES